MDRVRLDYRVPPADLRPYVTLFYDFAADVPAFEDIERADHAQLRFRLSRGHGSYHFADGTCQDATPVHVLGPTTGATLTRAQGPVRVVGLGLQPAGWAEIVGLDASTFHNRAIDAAALFGPMAETVFQALDAALGVEERLDGIEAFVRRLVSGGCGRDIAFAKTIDSWLSSHASPEIEDIVALTGLSRRQVERRCKLLYGAPPKMLARKYRALRAATALANGDASVEALIGEAFYDQSHLIREFKQFLGLTPRQIVTDPGLLAQMTLHRRYALGDAVHPIISRS